MVFLRKVFTYTNRDMEKEENIPHFASSQNVHIDEDYV